jgi:hypothetical protein
LYNSGIIAPDTLPETGSTTKEAKTENRKDNPLKRKEISGITGFPAVN